MSIDYRELTGKLIIENSDLKDQLSHAVEELEGIYNIVEIALDVIISNAIYYFLWIMWLGIRGGTPPFISVLLIRPPTVFS